MPTVESTDNTAGQAVLLDFFGLREQPYGVTPDPRFLYTTASHREALASLIYAIETKRGFSALVAQPGMGKTTLLFHVLDKIKSTARTAFLFRPDGNSRELLQSLLLDLGLEASPKDVPQMHEMLNSVLLEDLHAGRHFVWVIDEAQDLDSEVLESVRLLSNFETPVSKLMHIVLAGQPGLAEKLASPELLQLRQRVSTLAYLEPLSTDEASDYIRHRARQAGCRNPNPKLLRFTDRSSMAFSREVRLPYLDHRVVEYLFAIPEALKIRGAITKFVLRNAVRGRLPDEVTNRTDKKGFETPQSAWLRGPLRVWAECILRSNSFRERGWVDQQAALQVWHRFLMRSGRNEALLFRWLSLEVWARAFLKPSTAFRELSDRRFPLTGASRVNRGVLVRDS